MGLLDNIMGGATSALEGVVDNTIGLPFQMLGNQLQQNQNQALTNQQLNANEALSAFNYNQQYQMWLKTNYPEQVKQLEAAGLNPALEYGMHGGGGATTGSPSGGIGMGMATNPAQTGSQSAAAAAAADAAQAQAANTAAQTPQEGDLMKAQIASINQGVNNAKATEALTDIQAQTARLENNIKGETIDDQIATIRATAGSIENEMQRQVRQNNIDAATMQDKIKTVHAVMIGQFINNNLQQSGIDVNNQQIKASVNKVMQDWQTIGITKQNAETNAGQLKLQQWLHDIPDSKGILLKGVTQLIQTLPMAL